MPFTNAMFFGMKGGQFDATVTFSGREANTNNFAGFYSTPVIVTNPSGLILTPVFYAVHPLTGRGTASIALLSNTSYQITVIENYTSAVGNSAFLGIGQLDGGGEFQAPFNMVQVIGELWDTSSFKTFTASVHTPSHGAGLVVSQNSEDINDSLTGTLKLGISRVS
jgi:hypothetical protein